jgi:hypothetical protein
MARHRLTEPQALALLGGLDPLGLFLWCPDDATAALRLEGGGRGLARLVSWWATTCAGEER